MKKLLLLMLSFFMVLGVGMAKASSRISAMSADINVVEDYDLIFTYPNKVLDYKNTVDFRMGSLVPVTVISPGPVTTINAATADDWGGFLDGKFEKIGVIGAYLHRPNGELFTSVDTFRTLANSTVLGNVGTYLGATPQNLVNNIRTQVPVVNPLFDLFWGKEMGKLGVGVKVDYADSKTDATAGQDYQGAAVTNISSSATNVLARQVGVQLGVGMKDLGPFQEANFAAGYVLGKVQMDRSAVTANHVADIAQSGTIKDNGIYEANVNANLRHDIDANNNMKLFAGYGIANFGLYGVDNSLMYQGTGASATMRKHATDVNVGLGCNHTVNEGDGLVAVGLRAEMTNYSETASFLRAGHDAVSEIRTTGNTTVTEITSKSIMLPVFVSVEAKVKSWLTLRAGAQYFLFGTTTTQNLNPTGGSDTFRSASTPLQFNTGFGLNWKNWVLDAVLDTNALETNICNVQPGRGLLFGAAGQNTLTVVTADLKYKF